MWNSQELLLIILISHMLAQLTLTIPNMQHDVIIVGAGHNGLTAAAYLAKAGKKVLMLERRDVVGGCAVTEEVDPRLAPGCRVSTASYIASMLRPTIIRDLKLASYGLKMVACDPGVQAAFDDNDVAAWWSEEDRMRVELQRIAPHRPVLCGRARTQTSRGVPATVFSRTPTRPARAWTSQGRRALEKLAPFPRNQRR
jgi:phytoene dehydrogenase-like protein